MKKIERRAILFLLLAVALLLGLCVFIYRYATESGDWVTQPYNTHLYSNGTQVAGTIYDVKWSEKGFGSAEMAGKYLESPQHPAYLYCVPGAFKFVYLCSDGESLYTEAYTRAQTPDIAGIIRNFRQDIRLRGLEALYLEKWRAA